MLKGGITLYQIKVGTSGLCHFVALSMSIPLLKMLAGQLPYQQPIPPPPPPAPPLCTTLTLWL